MAIARKNNRTARTFVKPALGIVRHHCFASPFVNPADERHNGKCDNAKKRHMATMPTHLEKARIVTVIIGNIKRAKI